MQVSVVGTVHAEKGLVTLSALNAILERIRPDVIFLELPAAALPDYRDGNRSNLESSAAKSYSEGKEVVLVPVDLPTPGYAFWTNNEYLFTRVEGASSDYRRLVDRHSYDIAAHGFHYLNSERSSKALVAIDEATHACLEKLNDSRLLELYDLWKHTNELRENAMLKGIEDHALLEPFKRGAFLIGAAHRQSIFNKLRGGRSVGSSRLEWDFSDFLLP